MTNGKKKVEIIALSKQPCPGNAGVRRAYQDSIGGGRKTRKAEDERAGCVHTGQVGPVVFLEIAGSRVTGKSINNQEQKKETCPAIRVSFRQDPCTIPYQHVQVLCVMFLKVLQVVGREPLALNVKSPGFSPQHTHTYAHALIHMHTCTQTRTHACS